MLSFKDTAIPFLDNFIVITNYDFHRADKLKARYNILVNSWRVSDLDSRVVNRLGTNVYARTAN